MKIHPKLQKHLEANKVKYEIIPHKKVFTAIDAAATLKVKLEEIAKSLVIKADKNYYMLILAANRSVNLAKLKKALKAGKVVIPKESELVKVLHVKPGALTGFGSLHNLDVVVDKGFVKAKKAIFASGSLAESIKIGVKDYLKLENALSHAFSDLKKVKLNNPFKKKIKSKIKKSDKGKIIKKIKKRK